jgi:putative transposase
VTDKVPDSVRAKIKNAVRAAYYAPNREVADLIAADVVKTYQGDYPAAMGSFQDDWEASVAYLRCPAIHHKRIRTTNLLERSFLEERRRTRAIPRFFSEKSCLKPVFATLWRASQRWQGFKMSESERQQLVLLRRQLGQFANDTQDTAEFKAAQLAA